MTWTRRATLGRSAALAAMLAVACSDDGDDGPVGNTGSIQVSVNPATLSIPQGGTNSVTVTLTRAGGFSGVVTLGVTGLPAGLTATISPTQLSGTTTNATVSVTAAAAVAQSTYTATITATAGGVSQATATYQVVITAAPDYSLFLTPATIRIPAGTSGSVTVNIERTSFTGAVAFGLVNPPGGISGAFSPTPSTTGLSSIVVTVAPNVAPGDYPLTIQGTANGPGAKTASLALTVTAPPTGGTSVEYQYCTTGGTPLFFAYQDGTGAWQRVTGTTSQGTTTFRFTIAQGRGGVLSVFGGGEGSETIVVYASANELVQDGRDACAASASTKTVTGTVAGVPAGRYGVFSLGDGTRIFDGAAGTNPITFVDVPDGPLDYVATRLTPGAAPDKMFIFRNLNVPNGGSLPTIDFNAAGAIVPATASATVTGGGGDDLEIFTEFITTNGTQLMWFDLAPSANASRLWAGMPASAMLTGDFHGIVGFATPRGSTDFRVVGKYAAPVADQSLVLGPKIVAPTISPVVAGSYPRFRFQGSFGSEYDKGVTIDVASSTDDGGNAFSLLATKEYLTTAANSLSYDFTMPDVSGLAGFPIGTRLTAGANSVFTHAFGFTGQGIFRALPSVGSEFREATKASTVTVP